MREKQLAPGELEELGDRLKAELGDDDYFPNPAVEERLFRLARAELQGGEDEKSGAAG